MPHRRSSASLPIQHCPNVTVLVLFLKEDVPPLHLALLHTPLAAHRRGGCVRDDGGLQTHGRIAEALLDLVDSLVEQDLRVARPEVPDSLGVYKDDLLPTASEQPQDEIRVEVAGFEKADAAARAQVP